MAKPLLLTVKILFKYIKVYKPNKIMMNLDQLLDKYKAKEPEIVFEWKDALTDARGWVVINSLRVEQPEGAPECAKD